MEVDQSTVIATIGSVLAISKMLPFFKVGGSGVVDTLYRICKSGVRVLKEKEKNERLER